MSTYSVGRRRIIVGLLLTSVLLLTLDLRGNAVFDRARSGANVVLSPIETAADVVTRPAVNVWRAITEFPDVVDENRRLSEQIAAQRGAEIAARNAVIENQRLRELNDLETLAEIPTVTASIIGESPNNFDQVVEIDRGTVHGIETGMVVVNQAGLVGKVTRPFENTSLVMLVTDPQYAVRVKILSEERPADDTETSVTVPSGLDEADVTTTTTTTTTIPVVDPDDPEAGADPDDPDADPDDPDDPDADPDDPDVDPDDPDAEPDDPDADPDDPDADPDGDDADTPDSGTTTTTAPPVLVPRETGTLMGQGGNRLPMVTFVTSTPTRGHISVGDTIFTAGGRESLAPPDIPVGQVANVMPRPGSGGTELEVALNVDLTNLHFVRVVLYKPPSEVEE